MKDMGRVFWLGLGLALGIAATFYFRAAPQPVWAGNDRHEDYIMATGPIALGTNFTADGIWLLDYRAGKLLGTIVDRNLGKIVGWAEVDLVKEFNIPPKQTVHFLMTTGSTIPVNPIGINGGVTIPGNPGGKGAGIIGIAAAANVGNTALYLTEVNTGRFGIYTMAPRLDGAGGMMIRRHDSTLFRQPPPP